MKRPRIFQHLWRPAWWYRRLFDVEALWAIENAIREEETRHRGELRFVAEGPLPLRHLLDGSTARDRAAELFSRLGVWDTEENCGILIYVQLADRHVEILADRGIAARVPQAEWDALCRRMEDLFRAGEWRAGGLAAISGAGKLLSRHFPARGRHPNELPDAPLIL